MGLPSAAQTSLRPHRPLTVSGAHVLVPLGAQQVRHGFHETVPAGLARSQGPLQNEGLGAFPSGVHTRREVKFREGDFPQASIYTVGSRSEKVLPKELPHKLKDQGQRALFPQAIR